MVYKASIAEYIIISITEMGANWKIPMLLIVFSSLTSIAGENFHKLANFPYQIVKMPILALL